MQTTSSLLFKPSSIVPPGQEVTWSLGVCSRNLGVLKALLQLKLIDVNSGEALATHCVPIRAIIKLPQIVIEPTNGCEDVNFGFVAEGSSVEKSITLSNNSERELAVLVSFSPPSPLFHFKENPNIRPISSSEMSCVLAPGRNVFPISLRAPQLEHFMQSNSKSARVNSTVSVKLDTPQQPCPMLASKEIYMTIVAISLNIPRSCLPLNLKGTSASKITAPLTLMNMSCISLKLNMKISYEQTVNSSILSLSTNVIDIEANSTASVTVTLNPTGIATEVKASVVITVESYGLEYLVPVCAISTHETLFTKPLVQKTLSVPLPSKSHDKPSAQSSLKFTHLQASKSKVLFPAIDFNTSTSHKLTFNNVNPYDVGLNFELTGTDGSAFAVNNETMTVPANGEATVLISFAPNECKDYSAVLICRTVGLTQKFKYSVSKDVTCCGE